jgi:DHA1 family multidrug resistance protein-like MFS transporter
MSLDESYHPVVLVRKADRMRRQTGDWSIVAKHDTLQVEWRVVLREYLFLPLRMLVSDPIVLCMSTFGAFVYGLLYLFLTAYPVVFQQIHHMSPGLGGLPYLAVIIGKIFCVAAIFMVARFWLPGKMEQNRGEIMPEWHLPIAIPGAMVFSVGLFWLGWTGYTPTIHPIVPTLSGLLTGLDCWACFSLPLHILCRPGQRGLSITIICRTSSDSRALELRLQLRQILFSALSSVLHSLFLLHIWYVHFLDICVRVQTLTVHSTGP